MGEEHEDESVDGDYSPDQETFDYFQDVRDQKEFESAMDNVRALGSKHQEVFVNTVCDVFNRLNDAEPTTEELHEIFDVIKQQFDGEDLEESDEADSEHDPEADLIADRKDYELAMEHVHHLAVSHQEEFVNAVCDIYAEENDEEPTTAQLYGIFGEMKQLFAEEAAEEEEDDESEPGSESGDDEDDEEGSELDDARRLGSKHQNALVNRICDIYNEMNDREPTTEELHEMFDEIKQTLAEEALLDEESDSHSEPDGYEESEDAPSSEDADEIDEELLAKEMESALDHVRSLGKEHQRQFVQMIFGGIKNQFADEAVEDGADADGPSERDEYEQDEEIEDDSEDSKDGDADTLQSMVHRKEFESALDILDTLGGGHVAESRGSFVDAMHDICSNADGPQSGQHPEKDVIADQTPYELALGHVRDLGRLDQESLLNTICDIYSTENGQEPTTEELHGILKDIRREFAEEALEDEEDTESEREQDDEVADTSDDASEQSADSGESGY